MVENLDISAPTKTERLVGDVDDAFQQWHFGTQVCITEMQTSRVFDWSQRLQTISHSASCMLNCLGGSVKSSQTISDI